MDRVRVFLRTSLFASRKNAHVPSGTSIVEGGVLELGNGGLHLNVDRFMNDVGDVLEGDAVQLFLPLAKIDNILVTGDKK